MTLAQAQHGVVTAAQLEALGCSRSRRESWSRSGRLHPLFRGVYVVGRPMVSRKGRWLAAVLACGPGAVLSHLSAALLWGLIVAEGPAIEVSAPRSRASRPGITVHRRRGRPRCTVADGIPVTTIEQTLEDLARTFAPDALRRAAGEAELHPTFDPEALDPRVWATVDPDGAGRVSHNPLEDQFARVCRRAKLPAPERNVPWGRWNIDFLWREQRVAVETDGRAVHARRTQFARDREKDRYLQLAGFTALRFTRYGVERRAGMVAEACRAALAGPRTPSP
jgi:very-short-patch-repair endonuclease